MKFANVAFLVLLILLSCSSCGTGENSAGRKPNILCIMVDDLGYGDLHCQGATDLLTPNIDQLSMEGMRFTDFYANCTVCSPSRASLLTGRYPDLVGVPGVIRQDPANSWGYLDPDAVLIPEVLKPAGYHTAIIGKWHLGLEESNSPNARGFDYFKGFLGDMMDDYWTHMRGGKNWMRYNDQVIEPAGHATNLFTEWAIEYMEGRKGESGPFYLYLAYNAPHFPIQPPAPYLEKVLQREPGLSEERAKNVAFIEHLDDNIGKLMDYLEASGLLENTFIIFTSDNGGSLRYAQSNGSLRGGKQDMYEGGIRVPAFFYWKERIQPASRSGNFAMLMDLFPTICDVAGADISHPIDGISILPTLRGEEQITGNRTVFWVRNEGGEYGGKPYHAARYMNYKILQNTPFEPYQYFDLAVDPSERNPLSDPLPEEFQAIKAQLMEHIQSAGAVPWQK